MKLRRINLSSAIAILLLMSAMACQNKKQLSTAKGNAVAFGEARCECEKLSKKDPPGDTTDCNDRMAKATRYLNINFEFGKFSEAARQEVNQVGIDAYTRCMATP